MCRLSLVRLMGLEPIWSAPHAPQTCASASSATAAFSAFSGGVSIDLSYRAVASQVLSAQMSLTTVFGMGTGGPSSLMTLTLQTLLTFVFFWCTFRDSNPGPTD